MEAASAVDMEVGEAEEEADAFLENEILTRGAHYVIACGYSLGGLGKCWSPQTCSRLGVLQDTQVYDKSKRGWSPCLTLYGLVWDVLSGIPSVGAHNLVPDLVSCKHTSVQDI